MCIILLNVMSVKELDILRIINYIKIVRDIDKEREGDSRYVRLGIER